MSEQIQPLNFQLLLDAVKGNTAAIRLVTRLNPAGGMGDKVFPPTYEGGHYATEIRRIDDREIQTVLLDSVQSQANRMELALLAAQTRGEIGLPLMVTEFDGDLADIGRITALQAPHRVFDAIFRDSLLDGKPFRESERGAVLERARLDNATPLLELCPTALIFGAWDSTNLKPGYSGPKFERAIVSEIVGYSALMGTKTASRIDPLQIGSNVEVFRKKDGGWTTDPNDAEKDKDGKAVLFSRRESSTEKGRPSVINHSSVTPHIIQPGGVTISHAVQTTVLSLIALRRLHFPLNKAKPNPESDLAAQTLLASLSLCAVTYLREEGYDLRSRCLLVPEEEPCFKFLSSDGSATTSFSLTSRQAANLLEEAAKKVIDAKFNWQPGDIKLEPSKELIALMKRSRELAGKEA